MSEYQLIVIGAGPGGYMAALRAAKLGLRTAVVERREAGGTCLNRGCVPTKTLLHASEIYHDAVSSSDIGIQIEGARADMRAIFAYKRQISQKLSGGVEGLFQSAGVALVRGTASVSEPHTVHVTDNEGNETVLTAEHILVATGSVPARPPIPGLELPGVMTSDELLEGTDHLYQSIVIMGGGVIGVEFATFYSDLGCDVTMIEGMNRLLPTLDRELGQNLEMILKKQGVKIFTGSMVQNVELGDGGLTVNFTAKDKAEAVSGEAVLCAIGRRPYLEGLFPGTLQPEMNGRAIRVDARYQTSIPGVYAIGDVSSKVQLAHVASAQGVACVEMLCGAEPTVQMNVIPSCIYCRPEIAVAGMTDAEAKTAGIPVKTGKCVMFGNARTLIVNPGRCFMKLVANSETHEILGAQLMSKNSTDIIGEISQAIANRMTVEQMLLAMRPHPTFDEALTEALEDLKNKLSSHAQI